jgi:hypothetical protein
MDRTASDRAVIAVNTDLDASHVSWPRYRAPAHRFSPYPPLESVRVQDGDKGPVSSDQLAADDRSPGRCRVSGRRAD